MARKKNTATSGSESDVATNQNTEVPVVNTEASAEETETVNTEVPVVNTEASAEETETVNIEVPAVSTEASVEEVEEISKTFSSVDGTEFEFTVEKFIFKGKEYTTEEALENEDVLEALVQAKSFVIKKV